MVTNAKIICHKIPRCYAPISPPNGLATISLVTAITISGVFAGSLDVFATHVS